MELLNFEADGTPNGNPGGVTFSVGTTNPTVWSYGAGDGFVEASTAGPDIRINFFSVNGGFSTGTLANTTSTGVQMTPDVVTLKGGRTVVVWSTSDVQVSARLFDVYGAPVGPEFAVSAGGGPGDGTGPKVTALESGGFVITWADYQGAYPSDIYDIRARIYDANGAAVSAEFLVNSRVTGQQAFGDVVGLADGGFIAVWHDVNLEQILAQQFDPTGGRVGGAVPVGEAPPYLDSRSISATLMGDGRVAVTWQNNSGDGSNDAGVRLQLLDPRDGIVNGTNAADTLYGGFYDDQITARGGADVVFAGAGRDQVWAGEGSDTVRGDGDADQVFGQGGDDRLSGGAGNDELDGGSGGDTADYGDKSQSVVIALKGATAVAALVGGVAEDTLVNIENLVGGSAADTLTGDALANRLEGGGGNDLLKGGGGADVLDGGAGIDVADYRDKTVAVVLKLNGAADEIATVGGVAEDTVRNVETIYGGSAGDTLTGDPFANLLVGGAGNDVLRGRAGKDVLQGGSGVDTADYSDKTSAVSVTLQGALDAVVTVGGVAEDTIRDIERVFGGTGKDTLAGDALANLFRGGGGGDTLTGGGGADVFLYTSIADSTVAVAGRDTITDFSHAQGDKISLAGIDAIAGGANDAFTFAPITAGAPGRLAVTGAGANTWLVQGDVDGNGVADFSILVTSSTALVAGDFVL